MSTFIIPLALIVFACATSSAQTYSVQTFDFDVTGANSSGEVIGNVCKFGGDGIPCASFGVLDVNGKETEIQSPRGGYSSGDNTIFNSLNSQGEILGYYSRNSPVLIQGNFVLNSSGTYTYFGQSPWNSETPIFAYGLNNLGEIVGTQLFAAGASAAFKLSGGVYSYFSVPGQPSTMAFGINDSGEIVGETGDIGAGPSHGFVYSKGTYTTVDYPGATYTVLTGIDDYGVAAGYYSYYNTVGEYYLTAGFLFDHGTYRAVPLPQLGNVDVQITGIINGGTLYGNFSSNAGSGGFIATPVTGDAEVR